jgi:endonuclease/exonuclease/phosphatase family metal-dependent hydrolase
MNSDYANSKAQNILFKSGKSRFSFTNVHLPCDSVREKEKQIVAIDNFIHKQKEQADYFLLLGDFNSGINSSVHRFLTGEQTINNQESNPYWIDIIGNYAALHNLPLLPTLDCINNPRWKGKDTIYAPEHDDRIYVLDNWAAMKFTGAELFGTAINPINNLSASDHYGVMVDVEFIE